MDMIDQVAAAVHTTLTHTAADLGRSTSFVQCESKLNGATFVQTLVFTYLANPHATLEALTQTAATLGVTISTPGLDQRFTEEAAHLLQQVLAAALTHLLACASHDRWDLPILTQFPHVFLEDSTQIALPAALRSMWSGTNDTDAHPEAMLKICLRLDVLTGVLETLSLHPGRCHDRQAAAPSDTIPPGALYLADLGFFVLPASPVLPLQMRFSCRAARSIPRCGPQTDAAGLIWSRLWRPSNVRPWMCPSTSERPRP